MQLNPVYLYPNKVDVYTNVPGQWNAERYRRVYNRNVKIFRGVDNRLDIQVRNSDEKSIDISGYSLVFNLIGRDKQNLILSKDCDVNSLLTGKVYVTLTDTDLRSIESGFYQYSIVKEIRIPASGGNYTVSSRTPLYIDSQYGALATIEVLGDLQGTPIDSLAITSFSEINPGTTGNIGQPYFYSSHIDANYYTSNSYSNHTFVFYTTDYSGSIEIQGSLSDSSDPKDWAVLDIVNISSNPITYHNVVGKWKWFRTKSLGSKGSNALFVVGQTTIGTYTVDLDEGGTRYNAGDQILISGALVGGVSGANDIIVTVTRVNAYGQIQPAGFTWVGLSAIGFRTYVIAGSSPLASGRVDKVLYR